jgi:hypothetical protein
LTSWPPNALRHGFASYHLAKFNDQAKLAIELGHTKQDLLFRHYQRRATRQPSRLPTNRLKIVTVVDVDALVTSHPVADARDRTNLGSVNFGSVSQIIFADTIATLKNDMKHNSNPIPQTADFLANYLKAVEDHVKRGNTHQYVRWWFRGHADANWKLAPRVYREGFVCSNSDSKREELERQLKERLLSMDFRDMSAGLIEPTVSAYQIYFIQQHYGMRKKRGHSASSSSDAIAALRRVRAKPGGNNAAVTALKRTARKKTFRLWVEVVAVRASNRSSASAIADRKPKLNASE